MACPGESGPLVGLAETSEEEARFCAQDTKDDEGFWGVRFVHKRAAVTSVVLALLLALTLLAVPRPFVGGGTQLARSDAVSEGLLGEDDAGDLSWTAEAIGNSLENLRGVMETMHDMSHGYLPTPYHLIDGSTLWSGPFHGASAVCQLAKGQQVFPIKRTDGWIEVVVSAAGTTGQKQAPLGWLRRGAGLLQRGPALHTRTLPFGDNVSGEALSRRWEKVQRLQDNLKSTLLELKASLPSAGSGSAGGSASRSTDLGKALDFEGLQKIVAGLQQDLP
eukprot:CAMPEP_0183438118 /NCGR_PEP_ID=MMETSP0370-20130417/76219_1 /TAXON_ID=268820 /ORGANISM="Peridinium aciculiferum, Strain PAER-2" /LENGTH=276 /DNA_ID=CAMNT_0025626223 /DNA_START=51 /DNA_END=881 /DNA_ORIENTATION=-